MNKIWWINGYINGTSSQSTHGQYTHGRNVLSRQGNGNENREELGVSLIRRDSSQKAMVADHAAAALDALGILSGSREQPLP